MIINRIGKRVHRDYRIHLKEPWLNFLHKPNKEALWVFGFQKSGTSAIASLLAYRSNKSVTIDTRFLWAPYSNSIKNNTRTMEQHVNRYSYPFSKDIIKEPGATFYIDKIESFFSLHQYVFIIRNPIDNIRSILNRLNLPGDADSIDMSDVIPTWRHKFPSKGENYIEDLCNLWLQANSQPKYMNSDNCILVRYEDFKQNKDKFITSLCERLNFEPKTNIKPIMDKQFQPRGNSQIKPELFFGANLSTVIKLCGKKMKELGYEIPLNYK